MVTAPVTAEGLHDLARSLDPVLLAQDAGITPDPFQTAILRSVAPRLLLLAGRQCGKSTTAALLALHQALYRPDSLILLVSPSQRQSGEIFRAHVMRYYHNLVHTIPLQSSTQLTCEFTNNSRIISLPGDEATVRTYSNVQLIVIDEAARVPDDLYYSVRPMLATSNGRLVCLSTPRGKRGFFYHEYVGEGDWERHETRATDCARISADFLAEEKRSMGDVWFSQEYLNSFNAVVDCVFSYDEISAAFDNEIAPLFEK